MSLDCDQGVELAPDFARIKNELTLWAKLKHFPLKVTFELTPLCNFRCPMCYVHLDAAGMAKQGKLMSAEKWLEIGRQSRDMGALFVTLTGGEPFLHPEFWTIYNGLTEMGLLVLIFSNGYLIDEEVVEKLKANPPHNIKWGFLNAVSDWVGHSEPVRRTQNYDENRWGNIIGGHYILDKAMALCGAAA